MQMGRRDFIKGMMALAGTVAAGQILVSGNTSFPYFEEATLTPAVLRPSGRLGSLRIDDKWFSLEDSAITTIRRHISPIAMPNPTEIGKFNVIKPAQSLSGSPWQIDLGVREPEAMDLMRNMEEVEFEIDTRFVSFLGRGYLTAVGSELFVFEENPLYTIQLEGDSRLTKQISET